MLALHGKQWILVANDVAKQSLKQDQVLEYCIGGKVTRRQQRLQLHLVEVPHMVMIRRKVAVIDVRCGKDMRGN